MILHLCGDCLNTKKLPYNLFRQYPSTGFSFELQTNQSTIGHSSFDNYAPWKNIRRCTLSKFGEVVAYEGESNYNPEDSEINVMVEIPKFWYGIEVYETENASHKVIFHISPTEKEGYYVSPRHQKFGSMAEDLDKIYVSAYNLNNYGSSIKNSTIDTHMNCVKLKEMLQLEIGQNRMKNGFIPYDYLTLVTIELLRIVETGTMNFASIGNYMDADIPTSPSDSYPTGLNDEFYHSSHVYNDSVVYRHMENLNYKSPFVSVDGYKLNIEDPSFGMSPMVVISKDVMNNSRDISFNFPDQYGYGMLRPLLRKSVPLISNPSKKYQDWSVLYGKQVMLANTDIMNNRHNLNYVYGSDLPIFLHSCSDTEMNITDIQGEFFLFGDMFSLLSSKPINKSKMQLLSSDEELESVSRLVYLPIE